MDKQAINARLQELGAQGDRNASVLLRLRLEGHVNGGNCQHCKVKREAEAKEAHEAIVSALTRFVQG